MIYDLNAAIEPCDVITYKIDGKEYIIPLEVSDALAYWLTEHLPDIGKIYHNGKFVPSREIVDLAIALIVELFRENYPEIDDAWVRKHITFRAKVYILAKAAIPIIKFITGLTKDFTQSFKIDNA